MMLSACMGIIQCKILTACSCEHVLEVESFNYYLKRSAHIERLPLQFTVRKKQSSRVNRFNKQGNDGNTINCVMKL